MTDAQRDKIIYKAMKDAAKGRKIKLSAGRDLYKRAEPYFFSTFYYIGQAENGKIGVTFTPSVKYCRYDELQYSITNPGSQVRFTDKLRANSGIKCDADLPRIRHSFDYSGSDEAAMELCGEVLDYLREFYDDFLVKAEREFGGLLGYFIANRDSCPRLAGLALMDGGDLREAAECFASPMMDGENQILSVEIHTEEERRRAMGSGVRIYSTSFGESVHRSRKEQFADYAVALRNGLEWNRARAMFGLTSDERGG